MSKATCVACGEWATITPTGWICVECVLAGWGYCRFCLKLVSPEAARTTCAAGHYHGDHCAPCAAEWASVCPESTEALVARELMR